MFKKLIRKILIACAVLGVLIFIGWLNEDKTDYPGRTEFEAANALIITNSNGIAFGNNDLAKEIAKSFSESMKALESALFTGGSGKSFASGGEFVTYCQLNEDSIAIIVHVPELRNYKDDVRDALSELAWSTANSALENKGQDDKKLIVGLRGFASYGPILSGTVLGDVEINTTGTDNKKMLYSYFPEEDGSAEHNE